MTLKRNGKKRCFYIMCALLVAVIILSVFNFTLSRNAKNLKDAEFFSNINVHETEDVVPRYGFTEEDIYLLALLLCGDGNIDGDGEYDIDFKEEINYYEVGKVLGVVMNRVRSDEFPNTVKDVVLQKGQFSVIPRNLNAEPSVIALITVWEWCLAYDYHINLVQVVPRNHIYFTGNGVINNTRAKF